MLRWVVVLVILWAVFVRNDSHIELHQAHRVTTLITNDQQLDCALDLMRRLPPQQIEKNLSDLIDLCTYKSNVTN
ncbi:F-actin-capping protein subunit beta isoform X2 [Tachysurus ichikawai]